MSNKLKYVTVYNQIFERLQSQVYAPGTRLPSEKDLAEEMGVSRMTLRKALALLQEDNLITNKNGLGNFVNDPSQMPPASDDASIGNPIYKCCTEPLDQVELAFRLEPPTNSIIKALDQRTAAVVIAERWFKHGETACGYTLSFIPIEVISREKIDLNDIEALKSYLEQKVYQSCSCVTCTYQHSTAGNFTSDKYALSDKASFILIQETIFGEDHQVLVSSKHYVPVELFKIEIHQEAVSKKKS